MKWIRSLIVPFAFILGVTSAYAESNRVIVYYVNICDSLYSYTRVSNYDPLHCHLAALKPCVYHSPVDLGAYTYEASLIAAGATPSSFKGCYIVE